MKRLLVWLVLKVKGYSSYQLDGEYTARDIIYVFLFRGKQLVRGLFFKIKTKSSGLVFSGKGVNIEHGYRFSALSGLVVDDYVYINCLSKKGIRCGRNVFLGRQSTLVCTGVLSNQGEGISIGDYAGIGAQSYIGGQGGVRIGRGVIAGPGLRIFSENHNYSDISVEIRMQGETRAEVVVGDNCWIGAGVTLLCGVEIGEGCVIAAGSVVTKSLPAFSVAAGVPAQVIAKRNAN